MLTPDYVEALRFLNAIAPGEEITFQTFDDKGTRGWMARVFHGSLDQWGDQLTRLNREGAGIFFMVNQGDGVLHSGKKTVRTEKNVIRVRAHFVDLDGAPLEPVLGAPIAPQIIVESSKGKYHAYWLVQDGDLRSFKPDQQKLATRFHGDPSVVDLPRVLRVPGFWHQKAEPFLTRVVPLSEIFI